MYARSPSHCLTVSALASVISIAPPSHNVLDHTHFCSCVDVGVRNPILTCLSTETLVSVPVSPTPRDSWSVPTKYGAPSKSVPNPLSWPPANDSVMTPPSASCSFRLLTHPPFHSGAYD